MFNKNSEGFTWTFIYRNFILSDYSLLIYCIYSLSLMKAKGGSSTGNKLNYESAVEKYSLHIHDINTSDIFGKTRARKCS